MITIKHQIPLPNTGTSVSVEFDNIAVFQIDRSRG